MRIHAAELKCVLCFPATTIVLNSSFVVDPSTLALSSDDKRESNNWPTLDCNAATRKLPRGSEEARSLSMISCTPALQRLHFPSNRMIGRESEGLKIEGMEKSGVEEDFCAVVCFLMLRPKRV